MKVITEEEYEKQWEETCQEHLLACDSDGFDTIERYKCKSSQHSYCQLKLRPEFHLEIIDSIWHEQLNVESLHDETVKLIAKFYLSGNQRVLTPGIKDVKDDYIEKGGENYLFFLPNIREIEIYPADHRMQFIRISLGIDCFSPLMDDFDVLPLDLRLLLEGDFRRRFHCSVGRNVPAIQLALRQILNCPYQGVTKRMFLESKALELLALQLTQWLGGNRQSVQPKSLKSSEIERLHYAKKLIVSHLQNPPTLKDLAQQVGLNDFKLKQGFREIFGTTVFGYLRACRMEQAQQLLAEGQLTIAGVAQMVGYTSQSRFCDAFKRQFSITPRDFRASLKL
jgi:AraC-like DNA-binding protein